MRVDLVAWGNDIPGLSVKSAGKGGAVKALAFRYSNPVSYRGPRVMQIFQRAMAENVPEKVDAPDAAVPLVPERDSGGGKGAVPPMLARLREKKPDLVALATLPNNASRVTVLLAPGPEGTYQAHVINDDPRKLPPGRLRIHNMSPIVIALRINGGKLTEVKPFQSLLVAPKNGHVVYELAYREGKEWAMQENNLIRVPADEQVQFVVLKSDNRYFVSSDGSAGGHLQTVTLRRGGAEAEAVSEGG